MFRYLRIVVVSCCLIACALAKVERVVGEVPGNDYELIRDKDFQRGFILWKTEPGKEVRYGELSGVEPKVSPAWGLYQWSSRYPLENSLRSQTGGDLLTYQNIAKSVAVGTSVKNKGLLLLAVNTGAEYGPHARTAKDPWVHLLVQQQFAQPAGLASLSAVKFHIEARLTRSNNLHVKDYSADIHAAQFFIYFTLQNLEHKSKGYGDFVWFGVPIYDNRSRFPKAFKERDFGGTAKFIFTPEGEAFTNVSTHDRQWVVINKDLKPLMCEALRTAWDRGFLGDSKDLSDYYLAGMNMGWEMPGTFDAEMQIKNLSLLAVQEKREVPEKSLSPVSGIDQ